MPKENSSAYDTTTNTTGTSSDFCTACKVYFYSEKALCVACDCCNGWFHLGCVGIKDSEYSEVSARPHWYCPSCVWLPNFVPAAPLKKSWGKLSGQALLDSFSRLLISVSTFRPNLFKLPSGSCGKQFITECTRLIKEWTSSSGLESVALTAIHLMGPLLLQNPGKKSKPAEHSAALLRRLPLWQSGDFDTLLAEAKVIQGRLPKNTTSENRKGFARMMFTGRVGAAMRLLRATPSAALEITPEIVQSLKEKHPEAAPLSPDHVVSEESPPIFQPAIFHDLNADSIRRAAAATKGGCGPSGMSDKLWSRMLCSKAFGKSSDALAHEVALMTRRMCTVYVDPVSLSGFLSCKLIALDKSPGVRPIGVGEVLRRIVGRAVAQHLKPEIIQAAGPLQLAAGQQGGAEAAVHSMRHFFDDDNCQAVLLADARNAFNVLNRQTALVNLRYLCPALSIFAINLYRSPVRLFLSDGTILLSSEGTTQGCNIASPFYCISLRPLIEKLSVTPPSQIFYADDGAAAGTLLGVREWWNSLVANGPGYGYFPRPDKSVLIVKPEHLEEATTIFADTEVIIKTDGHRYLGAPIGSVEYQRDFVCKDVQRWVEDVQAIANIASTEPQAAYTGFCMGLSKRWLFLMRTTPNISELFLPLETAIRTTFLPAAVNNHFTPLHRERFSLPCRNGGLGIENPCATADLEHQRSLVATAPLSEIIIEQNTTINEERIVSLAKRLKVAKEEVAHAKTMTNKKHLASVAEKLCPDQLRLHEELCKRGSSTWLTSLPLAEHGFNLNKSEFWDALALRYDLALHEFPTHCACGKINSIEHCLSCARGGYVNLRHNQIRDLTANLLLEAGCSDVVIEPHLLPLTGETLKYESAIKTDEARLDVAARGVWSKTDMSKLFIDVRIFNSRAPTNKCLSVEKVLKKHEDEKKRAYGERILQVEKSYFTPVVFSTSGIIGNEADKFYKQVANRLSDKTGQSYADSIRYIRQRLSFCLLKTLVVSLRGHRGCSPKRFTDRNDFNILYMIKNNLN